jgi:porin
MRAAFVVVMVALMAVARSESAGFPFGDFGLDAAAEAVVRGQDEIAAHTPVTLFFDYYGVVQGNPVGGLRADAAFTQEMVFGGTVDLAKAVHWDGASLRVSAAFASGYDLSNAVGNFFTVSQAFVTPGMAFYELYLQQNLFDEKLQVRVGRMSSGDQFATLPAFGQLVSGGLDGNPSSLFSNAPFTSSPVATWGATVAFNPTSEFYANSGVFQATSRLGKAAYRGMDFSIREGDGVLVLQEVGWTPTFGAEEASKSGKSSLPGFAGLTGQFGVGAYYFNFAVPKFSGGTQSNGFGFYAMGQQMVWRSRADGDRAVSLWGGVVYSPQEEIAIMPVMGFAGAIWQGPIPSREKDALVFAWMIGNFSRDYADSLGNAPRPTYESVFEWTYIVQLNDNLSIQPDLQYIVRPGGSGAVGNALVIGLQFTAAF